MTDGSRAALYSAIDDELTHYALDVECATLEKRATVKVPATVQYAWPHPTRRYLYVTTSNRGPGLKADRNHISAFRIDERGALAPHGEPRTLPHRATHMCLDPAGRYALHAHNIPQPSVTVRRIESDGTIGELVQQREALDYGIYPHQVRVTASGRTMIVVDRGNSPGHGKPQEDPGALRSFAFDEGMFSNPAVVAPNGGFGFGPRHIDFHPTKPWLYVSDERRSQLYMFRMPEDRIESLPAFTLDTLADRANLKPRQLAGTIHVHPNGRYVYVANRADYMVDYNGAKVFGGGENSIAVFSIDPASGEPKPVQHADTHSYHVRTFSIDPSGRLMVAASILPMTVQDASGTHTVAAALSVFRIRDDGTLDYLRKYDVDTSGGKTQYWMGIVGL